MEPTKTTGRSLVRRAAGVLGARPITTSLFGLATLAWIVLCVLVGMPIPDAVGLWLAVALGTVSILVVRRRLAQRGNRSATPAGRLTPIAAAFIATAAVAAIIQVLPYRTDRTPPASTGEPAWASAETRDLMVRACFGCHSNDVDYPPYAEVAPISWLVQAHIDDGRGEVNYSRFATDPGNADESVETILDGSMPPAYYTAFGRNPQAVLTPEDVDRLVAGLQATPGLSED